MYDVRWEMQCEGSQCIVMLTCFAYDDIDTLQLSCIVPAAAITAPGIHPAACAVCGLTHVQTKTPYRLTQSQLLVLQAITKVYTNILIQST